MRRFSKKLYLAPLKGVTDYVFRNTYAKHFPGLDGALAPFLATVRGHKIKPTHLRDVLPENNRLMPVVPQILSKSSENFLPLARELARRGYREINWNLGCPFARVVKKGRGSGLLPEPDRVNAFLDRVLSGLPGGMKLSIKTRLGRYSASEINALIPVLNRYPIDKVIIHPRTAVQMYSAKVDLQGYIQAAERLEAEVVYNGDIFSVKDFDMVKNRLSCQKRWMIGRGVVANPFLPGEIRGKYFSELQRRKLFKAFHCELMTSYEAIFRKPGHLLNKMKGLWSYFALTMVDGRKLLRKIYRIQNKDAYLLLIESVFESGLVWLDDTVRGEEVK